MVTVAISISAMDAITRQIIRLAYFEDVKTGDITSALTIPKKLQGRAVILAKSDGILAGAEATAYAFKLAAASIRVKFHVRDGQKFAAGRKIVTVQGPMRGLLKGERIALNLLARLSGIATFTARFVAIAGEYGVQILDTRKTTPGLRVLEKSAVLQGGGRNHRMGLYDMVLIKDNHIAAAGGVAAALSRVADYRRQVEIEISDFSQLQEALEYKPDIIMLDNFDRQAIRRAVKLIRSKRPKTKVELSGGINLLNIGSFARTGVDFISVGALTHSAPAADFSMKYLK